MSEIRFYHLQRASLEDTLPVILERAYGRGDRILVMTGSSERAEALAAHLWTYKPDSFLPHGTAKDGAAATAMSSLPSNISHTSGNSLQSVRVAPSHRISSLAALGFSASAVR